MDSLPQKGDPMQQRTGPDPIKVKPLGDPRTHYWLALEMSQVVGLDLQSEMEAGRLPPEAWADAVSRCRGCSWSGECPAWMAAHRLDPTLRDERAEGPEAPSDCANADTFNALREGASVMDDLPR